MRVCVVAGARPNFMKIAPVVRALSARGAEARIVHTGQHYDEKMSDAFFRELAIPAPYVNLDVRSGTATAQIAEMMKRLEPVFDECRPRWVVVVGDVNSSLAAAIVACKMRLPLAHVEAGLRSFDREMPEELNRVMTDAISDRLYASEPQALENLWREGVEPARVKLVGNVMIDTLLAHLPRAEAERVYERYDLQAERYALATIHRPSNVDVRENLSAILRAIEHVAKQLPVLIPLHPRTKKRIEEFGLAETIEKSQIRVVEPLGYFEMIGLTAAARLVLTDSGGVQEETTALRVPCLTLRHNTERPITHTLGSNRLVGTDYGAIVAAADRLLAGPARIGTVPEIWDGHAAERIADDLLNP